MEVPYYAVLVVPIAYLIYRVLRVGRRPKDIPPGPPTLPILGNLHLMAKENRHLQFQKWAQEYGPVYSLMLGTKTMIVLSSDKAVKDLLDKKSANYSSRPDLYVGQTLSSGGKRMSMMPNESPWRTIRKVYHHALNMNKSAEYVPYQDLENKQLLYDMMTDSSDVLDHFRRYASSIVTSIVYGFRWPSFQDPLLQTLFHNLDNFNRVNATGGAALADFYPILRYIPSYLSSTKRAALRHYAYEISLYTNLYRHVKASLLHPDSKSVPCVCTDVIALQAKEGYSDAYTAHIPSQLWEAGSDTTSAELYGFVQALLLYPSVQAAGQAELDRVIGSDRMPTLEDMPHLPYVRACLKETLRWLPVAILGAFPHATIEEDMYMGHRIPAGASVILNTWTIHRDPVRYPDPASFKPERFIGDDTSSAESTNSVDASRRDHFGFGAGRRICQGMNVADRSMLLGIARIFWAFDIEPKEGCGLPRQDEFQLGFGAIPKRFGVMVKPRSEGKREIVTKEWERVRAGLGEDGQFLGGLHGMGGSL